MNSIGLAGSGISIDFKENLEDPAFCELCMVLERTYQMLHEPCKLNDITEALVNDLVDFDLIDLLFLMLVLLKT